ncbi:MAG: DUF3820 family protein [Prevotella sp.]|nr:DUF3820 family protein [Prevotella sp.]
MTTAYQFAPSTGQRTQPLGFTFAGGGYTSPKQRCRRNAQPEDELASAVITLRENQKEPIRKAIAYFRESRPKPSLIVLPTAWGKSILTAFVAKSTPDRMIVLQPSKELLEQNYQKYVTLCGGMNLNAAIYSASFNSKQIGRITYATIGSIKNIGAEFKRLGFTKMMIDEAHLYPREATSMLGTFLRDSGITHVLGLTATPLKLQTNLTRNGESYSKLVMLTSRSKKGNFFKEIIHVGQIAEMVELGYWAPLTYHVVQFDGSLLVFNNNKSEYTEESIQLSYVLNGGDEQIYNALNEHRERRHILVFVPSVNDAVNLAKHYPDSGAVYGEMNKKERADVISRFRSGELRVLFNVRVLTTGFDYTGIDCIIMSFSTASIALYYQVIGRATRIDPAKKDALIIDFGGNVERFGRVEDITFEKGGLWRMFGTDGRLLTGIPVHEIGQYYHEDVERVEQAARCPVQVMPFGKYKGKRLWEVPKNYLQWMLNNFTWTERNKDLHKSILANL